MEYMEIPSYLCPDLTKFELNQWLVDKVQKYITLKLTSMQTQDFACLVRQRQPQLFYLMIG